MPIDFLFCGAHPDDIEIGAGGTAAKLVQQGHQVAFCIFTDEADQSVVSKRRSEALKAAAILGVRDEHVAFLGLKDGHLIADRDAVQHFRDELVRRDWRPRVVVTHSEADSHNDHRAAAELSTATFRETCFLRYPVINHLLPARFAPRIFVDIGDTVEVKRRAMAAHESQDESGRLLWDRLDAYCRESGARMGVQTAELFEFDPQVAADATLALAINDCPFHRFWHAVLGEHTIANIFAKPVRRNSPESDWPTDKDRQGMALLRRAFQENWIGAVPIDEYPWDEPHSDYALRRGNCLLSGGAVSNGVTRTFFNHLPSIRYVIDYDMPDYTNIRILDKLSHTHIRAEYYNDAQGFRRPKRDLGILTVMHNPLAPHHHLVGCMGIHGFGTLACYGALSDRGQLNTLLRLQPMPLPPGGGYQVLVEMDVRLEATKVIEESFHQLRTSTDDRQAC